MFLRPCLNKRAQNTNISDEHIIIIFNVLITVTAFESL